MRGGSRLWPLALLVLTAIWAAATYFGRAAHGVTGSDPCAYAQMAVDLVQHGTLLHRFPLAPLAAELGIASWPTVHVGYHLPAPGES
ncbi:MAG: hypothetical protein HY260_21580, partial [Chloroflexi bacterium]|nr:hypothetical protein [Chloroflexota bacterium]